MNSKSISLAIIMLAVMQSCMTSRPFGGNFFPKSDAEVISGWLYLILVALGGIVYVLGKQTK